MSGQTTKILIVEDEFLIRMILAESLADEGFAVLEAENGEDALALLGSDPAVALLLTDMQLPGAMNGRALADAARKGRPDLPVIFTSGRPDTETHGPHETFVAKPYSPSDILGAIRRMTGGSGKPGGGSGC